MILFGESLNVISKVIGKAYRERDPKPIQEEVLEQQKLGMDYIDINLGPAKKDGHELMPWVVQVVQEAVPNMPLLLDTSNIAAIEEGLKVIKPASKPHIVNSIMARPERYTVMLPMVAKYGADMVALLWGPEGLPRDENERAALAVELCYAANEAGIPNENLFVDPIITPVNIQQPQLMSTLAFMQMLQDIAPGARSTNGLSNISNGTPWREPLNQIYMIMLERAGMYSCIADFEDQLLIDIARGKRPDLVEVVHKVQDGEITSADQVSDDTQKLFVRGARVILGHSLYSDSWMNM